MPFEGLREIKYVIRALIIMLIIGFRDDLINLRAIQKLFDHSCDVNYCNCL
jgi:UDP-GlcNAc:undecaprenyl-phosphate GlcNAc-1-phosphate transferase